MLRRSLLINLVISGVSSVAILTSAPSLKGMMHGAHSGFLAYAQNSEVLSPVVFRTLLPR